MKNVTGALLLLLLVAAAEDESLSAELYYSSTTATALTIYVIDSATGASSTYMTVPGVHSLGLAAGPGPTLLYVPNDAPNELVLVDLAAMSHSVVGPMGTTLKEAAYDSTTGTLYGTDYSNLYVIDTTTGAETLIGSFGGPSQMWALGFDPSTGTLYGADSTTDQLYDIDTTTGVATSRGAPGLLRISDLAFHGPTSTLFAIDQDTDGLHVIDLATVTAGPSLGALRADFSLGLAAPGNGGPGCVTSDLSRLYPLLAIKTMAGPELSWPRDPAAPSYHVNALLTKADLLLPWRTPRGVGTPECDTAAAVTTCVAPIRPEPLVFYQALSACDGSSEGPA